MRSKRCKAGVAVPVLSSIRWRLGPGRRRNRKYLTKGRLPLAGLVFLAQYYILLSAPPLIQLAETGVAIAVRVGLLVLLPEQLLGQVWMQLPLLVNAHGQGPQRGMKTAALDPAWGPDAGVGARRPGHRMISVG
jgi:hypothetical protein